MFAHELLENLRTGQKSKTFAEERAATEAMKAGFVGQCAGLQFLHTEKIGQLRMFAIEDRSRFADRALASGERVDVHPLVVARDRVGAVVEACVLPVQPD